MKAGSYNIFVFAIAALCCACAQIVSPKGGDVDRTPPAVLKTSPENKKINTQPDVIKLTFDEYFVLKNPSANIMVSPMLKQPMQFSTQGKTLIIKIQDTLQPNTTYNIMLNDAVADYTEGNLLPSYRYVFATGDVLDSLSIRGTVVDAATLKPENNVLVMLYASDEDSLPQKEKPYYFTKTDAQGYFVLQNLQEANYKIFALKDTNNNMLYDQIVEPIAFLPHTVSSADTLPVQLNMFRADAKEVKLLKATAVNESCLNFAFSRPVEDIAIHELSSRLDSIEIVPHWTSNRDTLFWYLGGEISDTLTIEIETAANVKDTVRIKPYIAKKDIGRNKKKAEPKKVLTVKSQVGKPNENVRLVLNYPLKTIHKQECRLTNKAGDTLYPEIKPIEGDLFKVEIVQQLKENTAYTLLIPDSTFESLNGLLHDTLSMEISTKGMRNFADLRIDFQTEQEGFYIAQLLTDKDVVVQTDEFTGNATIQYTTITPGSYRIRVIEDKNHNGKWDTGNYEEKRQPERVFYMPKIIVLKANWEVEENCKFDFPTDY